MKAYVDKDNRSQVMIFDSVQDCLQSTEKNLNDRNAPPLFQDRWLGKDLECWEDAKAACFQPWAEGIETVENVMQKIMNSGLPTPKSRRRRPRWTEDTGHEVCPDRWMTGQPDYWRDSRREVKSGPSTVCLLTNLDAISSDSPQAVMWRGAGAVAIADILENAGYNVDMHIWCRGNSVYQNRYSGQFTSINIKEPGEPVDVGGLITILTSWFTRAVVFGSFCCAKANSAGAHSAGYGGMNSRLDRMGKHMALAGDRIVYMPIVNSFDGAVGAVSSVLQEFSEAGDYEMSVGDWEEWANVTMEDDDGNRSC